MKGRGILTQEAFSMVIKWLAKARMDKEVIETIKNMGEFGLSPDLDTFNHLLISLCK
jgi:pentatricopeptide repeat protein